MNEVQRLGGILGGAACSTVDTQHRELEVNDGSLM